MKQPIDYDEPDLSAFERVEEEEDICGVCNGEGVGLTMDSVCKKCKGSGVIVKKP